MCWTLQRAGWLWFELELGDWRYGADYGWCTDFPGELLACTTALLELDGSGERNPSPYVEGDGEPRLDRWFLRREGETLHVVLEELPDGRETLPGARRRTERTCPLTDFGAALADAFTELLAAYGLVGYGLNWNADFPISRYLQLLSWHRGAALAVGERPAAENRGVSACVTELREELRLLGAER